MKARKKSGFTFLVLLLLFSCTEPTVGLWASLEAEEPVTDQKTPETAISTPSTIANFSGKYWLAFNGPLMSRQKTLGTASWVSATMPTGAGRCSFVGADAAGTVLYAVFLDTDYVQLGLYSTTDGTTWTIVSGAPVTESIDNLWMLDDVLYIAKRNTAGSYTILESSTAFATAYLASDGLPAGAASDGGARVVFITKKAVYLNGAAVTAPEDMPVLKGITWFSGDGFGTGGRFIISTYAGTLYAWDGASDWKQSSGFTPASSTAYTYELSAILPVSFGGTNCLFVGTASKYTSGVLSLKADGYFVVVPGAAGSDMTAAARSKDYIACSDNNFLTTLASKPVSKFAYFDSTVFALVPSFGVWSSELVSGVWTGFRQE